MRLDDWVPEAHVPGGISSERRAELQEIYKCAAIAMPRLLGTAVFVFMAIAMVRAGSFIRKKFGINPKSPLA